MRKTVVIICDGSLERQPRVLTEINALKADYKLILFGDSSLLDFSFYKLHNFKTISSINFHFQFPILIRKFFSVFISVYLAYHFVFKLLTKKKQNFNNFKLLIAQKPNLVIMHGMPHCQWVNKAIKKLKIPLVINMHEYYPLEFEDDAIWMKDVKPVYDRNIKRYFSDASAYFVVCDNIIKKYEQEFGFKNQLLIRNAKPFYNLSPVFNNGAEIKMIHHGASISSRKIELTIECMKYLPQNYKLDFMLVPDKKYHPKLIELAKNDTRIRFLPIVPTDKIIEFINGYDLGLFLLPPVNFNYLNALPNKLFEFIQARLAIVVSPNPEMKALIEEFEMGVVSKDYSPQQFANAILSIDNQKLKNYKQNTNKAATIINDEEEQIKILNSINALI